MDVKRQVKLIAGQFSVEINKSVKNVEWLIVAETLIQPCHLRPEVDLVGRMINNGGICSAHRVVYCGMSGNFLSPSILHALHSQLSITLAAARALSAVAVFGFSRTEDELVQILRRFPGLEHGEVVRGAINDLIKSGLLVIRTSHGYQTIGLASVEDNPALHQILASLYIYGDEGNRRLVKIVGTPADSETYSSFLSLLRNAKKEILLWIASASSYEEALPILRERALAGVRVRILMADVKAVSNVRGKSSVPIAIETNRKWKEALLRSPDTELRLFSQQADFAFSGSVYIDDETMRLNVFDWRIQRGMAGVFLEFNNSVGLRLNVFDVYRSQFERTWSRSMPTAVWRRMTMLLWRLDAELLVVSLVMGLYLFTDWWIAEPKVKDLMVGAAGSAIFVLLLRWGTTGYALIKRLLGG